MSHPCATCGTVIPVAHLLYCGDERYICQSCDAGREADALVAKNGAQLIAGPPLLALCGTLSMCIPAVGALMAGVLGALAMAAGVAALRMAFTGGPADGVTESRKPLLIVAGIIGGLWGLGLVGLIALALLGFALQA